MNRTCKEMSLFLLIAFILPLISIISQSIIADPLIKFILYGIEAASPSIAAAVIIMINKKYKEFFMNMFHSEHLVMAIFLPIIISFSTMFLPKLIFCFSFKTDFTLGSISSTQFIIILWALVAEEIGWRGYLQPLLENKNISNWAVPLIIGIVWCLWHYHYFLLNTIQVPILLFLIGCIIESYIYSFLMYYTNNNLISAMTYHFSWNLAVHIFAINPVDNNGNTFPYLIMIILEIFVSLMFLYHKNLEK